MKRPPIMFCIASTFSFVMFGSSFADTATLDWTRQFGTQLDDAGDALASSGLGTVYVSGNTNGALGGPNAGGPDVFLSQFDVNGNLLWTRQFGTLLYDYPSQVSVDGIGNAYLSGSTGGRLGPSWTSVPFDAFLNKYDSTGDLLWSRQIGGRYSDDFGNGVSADDSDGVYIVGSTDSNLDGPNLGGRDAFIRRYDANGGLLWTRQFGTSSFDSVSGVSVDHLGHVYVSGLTGGALGGPNTGGQDAFLSKYDADGNLLWTRQFGSSSDEEVGAVSADRLGNIYLSGSTEGDLGGPNAGDQDAFVTKFDAAGTQLWTNQFGTPFHDSAASLSADGQGSVYASGLIGSLGEYETTDAFVRKYDSAGNLLWNNEFGTAVRDGSFGVAADGIANVYATGVTEGNLGGTNLGSEDAFLVRFSDPTPEPATTALAVIAAGFVAVLRQHRCTKL